MGEYRSVVERIATTNMAQEHHQAHSNPQLSVDCGVTLEWFNSHHSRAICLFYCVRGCRHGCLHLKGHLIVIDIMTVPDGHM